MIQTLRIALIAASISVVALCGYASDDNKYKAQELTESQFGVVSAPKPLMAVIEKNVAWKSVEFNGKLRSDKLPISPTVKIYMVRDSLIQISLRAPLIGEVGRLTVTPRDIEIVNKLKKVYCKESMDNLLDMYPGLIADVQSLMLARVVKIPGGEISVENVDLFDVKPADDGNYMIIPRSDEFEGQAIYGYLVSETGRTLRLCAKVDRLEAEATIDYSYEGSGEQINLDVTRKGKRMEAELDFSSVKWGGSMMAPLKLSGYTRMGIADFVKSF